MTTTSTSRRSSSSGATTRWTGVAEGDLGINADAGVDRRRRAVWDGPWAYLHQVHGDVVHLVDSPGGVQGEDGDALVTALENVALAVFTADCAPVALTSDNGVIGIAHAGWRGLEAGVLKATIDAMRRLGARGIAAELGPCIHPCCYAFGAEDLERFVHVLGPAVAGRTRDGAPALDLPAAVEVALGDVPLIESSRACTSCTPGWFSHRARRDTARQAGLVVKG